MTINDRMKCRDKIIRSLSRIKKEAYSGLACHEYDAINTCINYLKLVRENEIYKAVTRK